MRLLIDSDVFCKLGVAGLLDRCVEVLGVPAAECGRLAALPHMLRRGRLPRLYGQPECAALVARAEAIASIPDASATWLDLLTGVNDIDPGEAQMFAVAAESGAALVTGDKRALRAASSLPALAAAIAGRIVTFEGTLMLLCQTLGVGVVRDALAPLKDDQLIRVCFSPGNSDPQSALRSYHDSLSREVQPLTLWDPSQGGGLQ